MLSIVASLIALKLIVSMLRFAGMIARFTYFSLVLSLPLQFGCFESTLEPDNSRRDPSTLPSPYNEVMVGNDLEWPSLPEADSQLGRKKRHR